MIIFHGNANLYITLSPVDTKHPLAYKFCMDDPNNFSFASKDLDDRQFRAMQTSKNPVGISLFFYNLVKIILDHLFGWASSIIQSCRAVTTEPPMRVACPAVSNKSVSSPGHQTSRRSSGAVPGHTRFGCFPCHLLL